MTARIHHAQHAIGKRQGEITMSSQPCNTPEYRMLKLMSAAAELEAAALLALALLHENHQGLAAIASLSGGPSSTQDEADRYLEVILAIEQALRKAGTANVPARQPAPRPDETLLPAFEVSTRDGRPLRTEAEVVEYLAEEEERNEHPHMVRRLQ